jgi:tripeptide aminopeptidase
MSLSNASIVRLSNSAPMHQARLGINPQSIIDRAIELQQVPAPTFQESKRAALVENLFQKIGLHNIYEDDLNNVYGWLHAEQPDAPTLLISAHTDTVFSMETDLSIRYEGERIYGAGLGDNSLGVSALLTLAELFTRYNLPHDANVCFLANTREEGLGNLDGIKHALDHLGDQVKASIILEGMALGRIYHSGIAVHRYKLTVTAPGGHSWLHYGSPSAIHALMQFGAAFSRLPVPKEPRTTYNIGIIEGGRSINTIAPEAHCYIDLRSTDTQQVKELENQMHKLTEQFTSHEVHFHFEQVGNRPAGSIPADHPLVRLAKDAHRAIGMTAEIESGSTDTNAPLARGIPAVCVGVSYGGNAHTLEEYIEKSPIAEGMWQLLLLTTAASHALSTW